MVLAQEDVWTSYMSEDFHNRHTHTSSLATNSSRATGFTSHLIEGLLLNLLRPTGVLLDRCRLLLRLHRLGFVFGRLDCLVSLSFSYFWLHVPLAKMASREAPWMARWNFTVRRVRFFVIS